MAIAVRISAERLVVIKVHDPYCVCPSFGLLYKRMLEGCSIRAFCAQAVELA